MADPTASPSPVFDFLKALGSGALAVPKAIGGGVSDVMTGAGGSDRVWQEQIGRVLTTLALGENMGAQIQAREGWQDADVRYAGARDTDLYRATAEGGGQGALDRVYGPGNVPPFASIPQGEGTGLSPDIRPVGPQWGGPTIEARRAALKVIEAQRALDYAHQNGNMAGVIYGAKTSKNGVELSATDRSEPLFWDHDWMEQDKTGLRGLPYMLDGKLAWKPEFDPSETARGTAYGTAVGKGQAKLSRLPGLPGPATGTSPRRLGPVTGTISGAVTAPDTGYPVDAPTVNADYRVKETGLAVVFQNGTAPVQLGERLFTPDGEELERVRPRAQDDPALSLGEREAAAEAEAANALSKMKVAEKKTILQQKNDITTRMDQGYFDGLIDELERSITPEALPAVKRPPPGLAGSLEAALYTGTQYIKSMHLLKTQNPELYFLLSRGEAFLGQLARRVAGETGVLTESDVRRAYGLIPMWSDSQEIAREKIVFLRELVQELSWRKLQANWAPTTDQGPLMTGLYHTPDGKPTTIEDPSGRLVGFVPVKTRASAPLREKPRLTPAQARARLKALGQE